MSEIIPVFLNKFAIRRLPPSLINTMDKSLGFNLEDIDTFLDDVNHNLEPRFEESQDSFDIAPSEFHLSSPAASEYNSAPASPVSVGPHSFDVDDNTERDLDDMRFNFDSEIDTATEGVGYNLNPDIVAETEKCVTIILRLKK